MFISHFDSVCMSTEKDDAHGIIEVAHVCATISCQTSGQVARLAEKCGLVKSVSVCVRVCGCVTVILCVFSWHHLRQVAAGHSWHENARKHEMYDLFQAEAWRVNKEGEDGFLFSSTCGRSARQCRDDAALDSFDHGCCASCHI